MTQQLPDYGLDLDCFDDLTDDMAEVSGVQVVVQATYRRLITPRGSIWNGPEGLNYGDDLREMLGSPITPDTLATLPAKVRAAVLQDDRIESCKVTVVESSLLSVTMSISCTLSAGPTFELVMSVDKARAILVSSSVGGT